MNNSCKIFNWPELKTRLDSAILILGSREISPQRVTKLTAQLLKNTSNQVVWGVLDEKYIIGLEDSPQFRTLSLEGLLAGLAEVDRERVSILTYSQKDTLQIIAQGNWHALVGVNGSWHRAFHYREEYRVLKKHKIPYKLVSAFIDEAEAIEYGKKIITDRQKLPVKTGQVCSEKMLFKLVEQVAKYSFDYTWQTGAVLAKNNNFLLATYNQVVPFEAYALLHGASKEQHLSPPQDLNHFDTNHAEVELVLKAAKHKLSLVDCSLYINLMPCPICARMLAQTGIKEVVYQEEHSGGYAETILKKAGKIIRKSTF